MGFPTDRSHAQALEALNQASLAIGRELDLDQTLQQIVDSARALLGARYAAVGVFNSDRVLERFVFSGISPEEAGRVGQLPLGRGLLGAVLDEGRPLRVVRISEHPLSVGLPPNHPPMTRFLGLPIAAGEQVLGNLYLTDKTDGTEFSEPDAEFVGMFATHAAVAIQNARLYEEVGRLAIVDERSRIGMDLHDGVIQSIYAVGLTLETIQLLMDQDPAKAHKLIGQAIAGLNDAIRDIRNFILDLRPRSFQGDLAGGLAQLVREFQANTMVKVDVQVSDQLPSGLPPPVSLAIFMAAQEALANIARHARASHVRLELEHSERTVTLNVVDDGQGFDVLQQHQMMGHGLANMRARAEQLTGSFNVNSIPGTGTSITLDFPLPY
ncbi:MAG: GAF domain-containing sensor histidine kinase [Anaerolineales bacterium]